MKKLFFSTLFLSAVFALQAQTVDEIAARHLEAIGGKANLDKITSLTMEGTMEIMNQNVAIKITKVPGKLFRQDISAMGMNGYQLITDTSGWSFLPFVPGASDPQAVTGDALKAAQQELSIGDGLVDYKSKGNKVELQGKEDVAGTDCYKLKMISSAGDTSILYVDTKNFLIARTAITKNIMGQDMAINIDYADYKEVDGVKFPFSMGSLQGNFTFATIKTNQPVDPKTYQP